MKKVKILAVLLAAAFVLTACGRNKDNNDENSGGVVSDVVSGTEDVVSDVVSGTDHAMSDLMGDDNSKPNAPSGTESDLSNDNSAVNSDIHSNSGKLETPAVQTQASLSDVDFNTLSKLSSKKFGWGQGTDVDDFNRPTSCLTYQQKYGHLDAYFIGENTKTIYLTFDEGYENGYTAKILDVLKGKNCPAVFFVTKPYVKEHPELIQRMISEGHVVGNHSVTHPSMPTLSLEDAAQEIVELHELVQNNFGYHMTLFRPPMGEWSEQTLALTQQLQYKSVFWSFAYKDWITDDQPDPSTSLNKLCDSLHNGSLYLLHAVSATNTAILGDFIDYARAEGYTFAKLQ